VYLIPLVSIVMGVVFGLVFRLLSFVLVLPAAISIVVVNDLLRGGADEMFADVLGAAVGLQIGYVFGIALRAALNRVLNRGADE
jgi:hypothetical protein